MKVFAVTTRARGAVTAIPIYWRAPTRNNDVTQPYPAENSKDLDSALEGARLNYSARRPMSLAAHESATRFMPGGNTRTVLYHGPFPLRIVSGDGCRLIDADGISYVNFLGEYTAGLFGHSNPDIRSAIIDALDRGVSLSGHNEQEVRLAQLVCDRFPSVDLVRFTNSGTEANLMAISAARCFTGRSRVMVFKGGYHGGLLYFKSGGTPVNAPYDYVIGQYNNVAEAGELIRENQNDLACVLVEPMQGSAGCIPASREFLQGLRDACDEAGTVLIFDEVMTSRLDPGGAQSLHGVIPDMTTLGKYIGGGMSFGAFGGRENIMALFDPGRVDGLPHAGTFNNNTITMSAGVAAMGSVLTEDALTGLNAKGDRLRDQLNGLAREYGARLCFTGAGSLIGMHALDTLPTNVDDCQGGEDRIVELAFLDLLERGYYVARRGFISLMLPLEDTDLEGFAGAFKSILEERQAVISRQVKA